MSLRPLSTYAEDGIRAGGVEAKSAAASALGFSAMVLLEQDLKIDVPPLDFNVLVLMLDGHREVESNFPDKKTRVVYNHGDQLIIPAGAPAWFASKSGSYGVLHLHFPSNAAATYLQDEARTASIRPALKAEDPLIRAAGLRLSDALISDECNDVLLIQSLFVVIARQLETYRTNFAPFRGGLSPIQN